MAIYVFSLLVGYVTSGVDYAQGTRSNFLKKTSQPVKYIFSDLPKEKYIQNYIDFGIDIREMLSAHLFLSDNYDLSGNCRVSEKLEEMKYNLGITQIAEKEDCIDLFRNEKRIATLILKEDRDFFSIIHYYENERLIISEYYAAQLLYKDFYATVQENGKRYARRVRTSFVNQKGVSVYDCLYDSDGRETYMFPNGLMCTKQQLMEQFVKKLNLSPKDIVLLDRPSYLDYVQALFRYSGNATFITFFHSSHYYEKGESIGALYLNHEYYYWFRNSNKIDWMLVSTEEQKKDLENKLLEYGCDVPRIEALPISGLDKLRHPIKNRKKYSLLTVSRLAPEKKIEWLIAGVIEAHKHIPEISLDIYGRGRDKYTSYLEEMVLSNHAENYIRFMGLCNVCDVYQDYEAYITTSVFETLGLSVMEAIGSGNAVIGLNVRYGNRLFIEDGQNGRLIDFVAEDVNNPEKVNIMISKMADAIVEMFRNEDSLKKYHEHSYKIAEQFLSEKIEKKWIDLIETITKQ